MFFEVIYGFASGGGVDVLVEVSDFDESEISVRFLCVRELGEFGFVHENIYKNRFKLKLNFSQVV